LQLDWQEDYLNWAIDGKVVRAVKKDETIDGEGNA
jgi:beta-glucanase (GH16 family)